MHKADLRLLLFFALVGLNETPAYFRAGLTKKARLKRPAERAAADAARPLLRRDSHGNFSGVSSCSQQRRCAQNGSTKICKATASIARARQARGRQGA